MKPEYLKRSKKESALKNLILLALLLGVLIYSLFYMTNKLIDDVRKVGLKNIVSDVWEGEKDKK